MRQVETPVFSEAGDWLNFSPFTCPLGIRLCLGKRVWLLTAREPMHPDLLTFRQLRRQKHGVFEFAKGDYVFEPTMRAMYASELMDLFELGRVEPPDLQVAHLL